MGRHGKRRFEIDTAKKVEIIAKAAQARKAEDIVLMHMGERSGIAETFVIATASSSVRGRTIADHIEETMLKKKQGRPHKEGYREAVWILLDYGDVIVHIFHPEMREFYRLESLWGDAPRTRYA